jgi:hypothetical protein
MGELISNVPGSLTITFETLDYAGEYLDTQNEVKIIPSGASVGRDDIIVTNLVQRKSKGKYEFTYNFDRGTYIIEIKSTSNLYSIETSLKSPSIFIEEGNTPPECTESTQCDAGRICLNNKCVEKDPPFGLYFGIGAISIFVIILLIIIINLMRKSRNINLGGGL